MSEPSRRIDRSYIAPQLSAREKVAAGAFTLLDVAILLFGIGTSMLVCNLFSDGYPRIAKLVNALVLIVGLAMLCAPLMFLLRWVVVR